MYAIYISFFKKRTRKNGLIGIFVGRQISLSTVRCTTRSCNL